MQLVPAETVRAILEHAMGQPPLLGGGRMVCVDGYAGSGKTTLADALAAAAPAYVDSVHVLHADDLLTGWDGLPGLPSRLRNYVVGPLASRHPARYRRFDWELVAPAEEHVVAPMGLLVLEGCATGHRNLRSRRATKVFVEAPRDLRLRRGLARDGASLRDEWLAWMELEERVLSAHDADVRVDEVGRLV